MSGVVSAQERCFIKKYYTQLFLPSVDLANHVMSVIFSKEFELWAVTQHSTPHLAKIRLLLRQQSEKWSGAGKTKQSLMGQTFWHKQPFGNPLFLSKTVSTKTKQWRALLFSQHMKTANKRCRNWQECGGEMGKGQHWGKTNSGGNTSSVGMFCVSHQLLHHFGRWGWHNCRKHSSPRMWVQFF